MKIVLAVIGQKGSGKETFTQLLKELLPQKKVVGVRTSAIMQQTLKLWHLPDIRENYSKLVMAMEEKFGPGALSRAAQTWINKEQADLIVVDGIRRQPEVDLVRSFPKNYIIYLTASPEVRFERIRRRGERENEQNMTFAQFQKEETLPTETLIEQFGQGADYTIDNSGSIEQLRQKIQQLIDQL